MKFQALATLSAVVTQGSFARAAEQVYLTPSAVSLQMKQLEAWLGRPLFDRSGRTVQPTALAVQLAATMDRTVGEIEAMRLVHQTTLAGRVRIGITESAQTTLLPQAYADLRRSAPQIALHVQFGATPGLLSELKAGRIDTAVVFRPPRGPSSRLHWTPLLSQPLVLVVPRALPPATPARVLREQPWIRMDRASVAGQMAARYVDRLVPQCQPLLDLPAVNAIVAMVGAGIGVSVLPRLRPDQLAAHPVREIDLGADAPMREMVLVRRTADVGQGLLDAVARAFVAAASPAAQTPRTPR